MMNMRWRKHVDLVKMVNNVIIDLPSPVNIYFWWNFGSLLGLTLGLQLVTGLFLSMHYSCDVNMAYSSVAHIMTDVNSGWFIRNTHANGASMFFLCLYCHTGRGIYNGSYMNFKLWIVGVLLLIFVMMAAFLGYILPWGQMSFWGATVITNLFSAMPGVGKDLVLWLWGGFAVSNATLTRFYTLHFIVPFFVAVLTLLHIYFLHARGSNNPVGLVSDSEKIPFHWYFTLKDTLYFVMGFVVLNYFVFLKPNAFLEPDNYIMANELVTPSHIVPEWYFLFAYGILRSIPNKLGGVVGLVCSLLVLIPMPLSHMGVYKSVSLYPMNRLLFWCLVLSFTMLTVGGAWPVDEPYVPVMQLWSVSYFSYFLIVGPIRKYQDYKLNF